MISSLNEDQLKALAKLCFDLAKAAFVLAMLSPLGQSAIVAAILGVRSFFVGLAFTYLGLVILGGKKIE